MAETISSVTRMFEANASGGWLTELRYHAYGYQRYNASNQVTSFR